MDGGVHLQRKKKMQTVDFLKIESVVYFALTTESKEALGALQALRILSSMLPTALKHFSSASIDIFRLYS